LEAEPLPSLPHSHSFKHTTPLPRPSPHLRRQLLKRSAAQSPGQPGGPWKEAGPRARAPGCAPQTSNASQNPQAQEPPGRPEAAPAPRAAQPSRPAPRTPGPAPRLSARGAEGRAAGTRRREGARPRWGLAATARRLGREPGPAHRRVTAAARAARAGITAEVLVVTSFDELQRRAPEARGKIVVYNQPYTNYSSTVQYRVQGAVEAAKVGALASLIRSVASFSIYSPHTGVQEYQDGVPKIPTACITVEDAEMMSRMVSRGNRIVIQLKMGARSYPDADSFNTVAEITGSKYPEQVVLVSGHLDSWDVGQGAMDDGGGAFISWEALSLIKDLGLRPKRTLRLVLWTAEEQGGIGAFQYYQLHKANSSNYSLVMESDSGTFLPSGLQFTGSDKARAIMEEVMSLLKPINITQVFRAGEGTDINFWIQAGVPGASLLDDLHKYFSFHHSHGDTMTVMDPKQMNVAAALWAVVSYVVADMEEMLPRS
uniref:Carboxypeptidase Q n=1 Tax=Equus caballus TaxID=9796 RepID=A0A3Q2LDB8_HORSE